MVCSLSLKMKVFELTHFLKTVKWFGAEKMFAFEDDTQRDMKN